MIGSLIVSGIGFLLTNPGKAKRRTKRKTRRNPDARQGYLRDAVKAAKAGASLREIVALTGAAGRIRKLTEAEVARVVKARGVCKRRNPPRDPGYVGAFRLGFEPAKNGPYVDGDTAVVESPYKTRLILDRPYEVWVFGMIDPRTGNTWNYVSGPMSRSDAVAEAKHLAKL
jgi:hypothetical protein